MREETLTAQEYIVWCVQELTALEEGPTFDHINKSFKALVECLDHLQTCYDLPSYESDRSN